LIALIAIFILFYTYTTEYKKTTRDTSHSPDGTYQLTLQAVGDPDWPFGSSSGRLILKEGKETISETDFELHNDGKTIGMEDWRVAWYEDYVEVTLSGEEQDDNQIVLQFDGTMESEYLEGTKELSPRTFTADYTEQFQSVQGCAVIFDSEKNEYQYYNQDACMAMESPNSTFKIISTLMGLHNQVVVSEDSKMGYSGVNYPVDAWNADLSMKEAFQSSCIWYYRKVIDEIGQDAVQEALNQLHYGNCDITEWGGSGINPSMELNGFWLESSLQISPVDQVHILRDIMEGETMYTESEVGILKSMMLLETRDSEKTYGKTASGTDGTAWFVGFVEREGTNIYIAVYLDDDTSGDVNGRIAQEIAFRIL
jgi:bla regulator protein BlaR1